MDYKSNVDAADRESQKDAAARDLYERIGKHLAGDRAQTARRWPWELIQNAHDVSSLDRGVHVRVDLSADGPEPTLSFEHDAGAFSSADLVSLVKRRSTKRGDPAPGRPSPLGRFGTGFLTTHLLARNVLLSGVVADPDLAPRSFQLPLDRTGPSEFDLLRGVEAAFDILHNLDALPALPGDSTDLPPTVYRYRLLGDGLDAAHAGLDDLARLAPYVLAFVPAVRSIEIAHTCTRFEVTAHAPMADGVHHVSVRRTKAGETHDLSLLLAGDNYDPRATDPAGASGVLVAVPAQIDADGVTLFDLDADVPRLFCGLPLVGTEALGLPVVISSRAFAPAPERDGLVLSNASDPQIRIDSDANKGLLTDAVRHTTTLLAAAADWRRAYVLAGDPGTSAPGWVQDPAWWTKSVVSPLRAAIVRAPLADHADGSRGALHADPHKRLTRFPAGPDAEFRRALWDLAQLLIPDKLPPLDDVEPWRSRLWTTRYDLPAPLVAALANKNESISGLAKALGGEREDAVAWVQRFVDLLREHDLTLYLDSFKDKLWTQTGTGQPWVQTKKTWQAPIIPDQHGAFRLLSDLHHDPGLPDLLKDVAGALGHDVRASLAAVDLSGLRPDHTDEMLARTVEEEAFDRIRDGDRSVDTAFADLLVWFDENPTDAARLFKRLYSDQHLLRTPEQARQDRRDAARTRELDDANQKLHLANEELTDQNASLKAEIDALRQSPSRGAGSLHLDDAAVQLKHHITEVWDAVRRALALDGSPQSDLTIADLERLRQTHRHLFEHLTTTAIDKYLAWAAMLDRAKALTRQRLDALGYDTDGWHTADAFPTIIEGVRRHPVRADRTYPPHEITLVIRPADGGYVVLYDAQEVAVLQNADTELWIEGDGLAPQRFTIGHLADTLGANRFPVRPVSVLESVPVN